MSLQTPILFITFARPEYAVPVFSRIKKIKPRKLYFYSNKARPNNNDEIKKNIEVRNLINEIDWPCDLKTFFQASHVNIYSSLFSAIDWVFKNEDQAIILEEDCLASVAFFNYCELLLDKYKNTSKVWMISGNNFTEKGYCLSYDYFFSTYSHIYGWASWKDRWVKIDRDMERWEIAKKEKIFYQYFQTSKQAKFVESIFDSFYKRISDTPAWDYLFWYSSIINNAYTIFPKKHLVGNIGTIGYHNNSGKSEDFNRIPDLNNYQLTFNNSPHFIYPDVAYDIFHFDNHINKKKPYKLIFRLLRKVKRILKQNWKHILKLSCQFSQ